MIGGRSSMSPMATSRRMLPVSKSYDNCSAFGGSLCGSTVIDSESPESERDGGRRERSGSIPVDRGGGRTPTPAANALPRHRPRTARRQDTASHRVSRARIGRLARNPHARSGPGRTPSTARRSLISCGPPGRFPAGPDLDLATRSRAVDFPGRACLPPETAAPAGPRNRRTRRPLGRLVSPAIGCYSAPSPRRSRPVMIRILPAYIVRQHIGPFIFGLVVITFVLIMDLIVDYLDLFLGKGVPLPTVLEVFFLSLGWMLALSIPMAVLVAKLMTYGRLSQDHEITAMRAGGVSFVQIIAPVFIISAFLGGGLLAYNDQVLPRANHRLANLLLDIHRKKP